MVNNNNNNHRHALKQMRGFGGKKKEQMKTRIEIEIQYLQNEVESIKDSMKETLDMNFFNVARNKVQRIEELTEKIYQLKILLNS